MLWPHWPRGVRVVPEPHVRKSTGKHSPGPRLRVPWGAEPARPGTRNRASPEDASRAHAVLTFADIRFGGLGTYGFDVWGHTILTFGDIRKSEHYQRGSLVGAVKIVCPQTSKSYVRKRPNRMSPRGVLGRRKKYSQAQKFVCGGQEKSHGASPSSHPEPPMRRENLAKGGSSPRGLAALVRRGVAYKRWHLARWTKRKSHFSI